MASVIGQSVWTAEGHCPCAGCIGRAIYPSSPFSQAKLSSNLGAIFTSITKMLPTIWNWRLLDVLVGNARHKMAHTASGNRLPKEVEGGVLVPLSQKVASMAGTENSVR